MDTNVLLRLFDRSDPNYGMVQTALKVLWAQRHQPVIVPQNVIEFWNVSTRPTSARGGFGQSVAKTRSRLAAIDRLCLTCTTRTVARLDSVLARFSIPPYMSTQPALCSNI